MANMKTAAFAVVMVFCGNFIKCEIEFLEDSWNNSGQTVGSLMKTCFYITSNNSERFWWNFEKCLKNKLSEVVDRILERDVIELYDGIIMVKDLKYINSSRITKREFGTRRDAKLHEEDSDWKSLLVEKIAGALNTHVLKIPLNNFTAENDEGRRRRGGMMPLLIFGTIALGMILIPMGFQFLAVLGGKALLLAKMALLLTSIQGLKKIATSSVNYGLYRTDPWHYDRQWPYGTEGLSGPEEYYEMYGRNKDLLHPLDPRYTTTRDRI